MFYEVERQSSVLRDVYRYPIEMKKLILASLIVLAHASLATATEQAIDRVTINGRTYGIRQQPMLGLWRSDDWQSDGRTAMPSFDFVNTAISHGYIANFSISHGQLHLLDIDAEINGKPVSGSKLLGKRLPVVARWYTGSIFIAVGEFDYDAQASNYVIEYIIKNGDVIDSRYHATLKLPDTWNGLSQTTDENKSGG